MALRSFPWDPSEDLSTIGNIIHGILAGGVSVLVTLMAIGFGTRADGKRFPFYAYGTPLVLILSGSAMALLGNPRIQGNLPPPWFGLAERISGYGFMPWMTVLANIVLRTQPECLSRQDRRSVVH